MEYYAFYKGTSLYDHDQITIYKRDLEDYNSKKNAGKRQYEYTRRPKLPMQMTKAKRLLSMEDINLVSSKICCKLNYMEPYPRNKILALQNQMWKDSDMKFRKYIKLEVHRQFHNNTSTN
jgi:hypothetical protein